MPGTFLTKVRNSIMLSIECYCTVHQAARIAGREAKRLGWRDQCIDGHCPERRGLRWRWRFALPPPEWPALQMQGASLRASSASIHDASWDLGSSGAHCSSVASRHQPDAQTTRAACMQCAPFAAQTVSFADARCKAEAILQHTTACSSENGRSAGKV